MKIKTERLLLREIRKEDALDIFKGISDKEVSYFMFNIPQPYKLKDAKTFVEKNIAEINNKKRKSINLVIELILEKKIIGCIGLNELDYGRKLCSIGYWLNKNYWKNGYMSEAVKPLIDLAIKKLKMQRITLTCNAKNSGSIAIANKFGFKLEGRMRKAHIPLTSKKREDKLIFGLLSEEWH